LASISLNIQMAWRTDWPTRIAFKNRSPLTQLPYGAHALLGHPSPARRIGEVAMLCKRRSVCPHSLEAVGVERGHFSAVGVA
jgi:hypothetical protein